MSFPPNPPTVIQGDNPECADLGNYRPVLHDESLKFSPTGTFPRSQTSTDGYLTVTVDKVYTDTYPLTNGYTGQFFDWHSDRDVDLVIAKGANGADSYAYDLTTVPGPNRSDAHLHAPINASGSYANLSHMDFCYKVRPDVSRVPRFFRPSTRCARPVSRALPAPPTTPSPWTRPTPPTSTATGR